MITAWGRLMVVMGLRELWGKTGHQGAGGTGRIMGEKLRQGNLADGVRTLAGGGAVRGKHRLESSLLIQWLRIHLPKKKKRNSPANARDMGSIPDLGRFLMPQSN